MPDKKRILIIDPPDRRSIPVVGSLGRLYDFHYLIPIRKGYSLQKLIESGVVICKPRHARSVSFLPFETEEDLSFNLFRYLEQCSMDVLLPFSERSTALICTLKPSLTRIVVPFGSLDDFNILNDKYLVAKLAEELDIPAPRFLFIEKETDLQSAAGLGFPLVLKCCRASGVKEALRICHNIEELAQGYQELHSKKARYSFFPCEQLVAQEFIAGKIYDGCFAVKDGKILASSTQIREWTIPVSGGVGAYNKTINVPEIHEYGQRLFERVRWTGPAQLEFIRDEKNGQYKLIEINPRFWGTLGLSVKAGVNFAHYVIAAGLDETLPPAPSSIADGIDFKWLLQETLAAELLQGKGKRTIIRHLFQIFTPEVNNFSYSIMANLMVSAPFVLSALGGEKTNQQKGTQSLANRLFT
jgi:predicted ATP-grasp superfamily ATP-dependent carboligase